VTLSQNLGDASQRKQREDRKKNAETFGTIAYSYRSSGPRGRGGRGQGGRGGSGRGRDNYSRPFAREGNGGAVAKTEAVAADS